MFEFHKQSEDRIHRVKQPVEVFEIKVDRVDEYVRDLRKKREILDRILGETNATTDD
jgi:N-glycosylase/DNA lyase